MKYTLFPSHDQGGGEDVISLIPNYLKTFITSQIKDISFDEIDDDRFMTLMGHKVYFTSPYKDSIIIFDKRYYKEPNIIKLPGTNKDD